MIASCSMWRSMPAAACRSWLSKDRMCLVRAMSRCAQVHVLPFSCQQHFRTARRLPAGFGLAAVLAAKRALLHHQHCPLRAAAARASTASTAVAAVDRTAAVDAVLPLLDLGADLSIRTLRPDVAHTMLRGMQVLPLLLYPPPVLPLLLLLLLLLRRGHMRAPE